MKGNFLAREPFNGCRTWPGCLLGQRILFGKVPVEPAGDSLRGLARWCPGGAVVDTRRTVPLDRYTYMTAIYQEAPWSLQEAWRRITETGDSFTVSLNPTVASQRVQPESTDVEVEL